ncbi:hypothetical protein EV361DRAFT_945974 [Lentinula raphanica]|nr:hypothetical protein EV361DRAFT_945974 [Lentinula raphanica]
MHPTLILAMASLAMGSSSAESVRRQLSLPNEACLCSNPQFISTTTTCIEGACSGNDLQTAISAAESLCAEAGVTLDASSILASVAATATVSFGASTSSGSASPTSGSASAATNSTSSSNGASSDYMSSGLWGIGAGIAAWIAY